MRPALTPLLRWLTLAVLVAIAFWVRTHDLAKRPMHADEANQAVKLGELLESGRYAFDPRDHHGPTLYYAALPFARIRGERTLAQLTETTVRLVPAFFGTASVILIALLAAPLGRWPALAAAAFMAVSPPAVYYSRYFVQETLLVTFTLGLVLCARTWWHRRQVGWAIAAGVCAGLMQATKATAPLFIGVATVTALIALRAFRSRERKPVESTAQPRETVSSTRSTSSTPWRLWLRPAGLAFLAFIFTAALLYSSFGANPTGLRDALSAYTHAFARFGSAASEPTGHEKPWWYYLRMFGWYREGGFVWHQAAFSALAMAGLVVALARRGGDCFLHWAALYSIAIVAAFSLFAYKTPWHAVHFVPGLALLAAAAVAAIARLHTGRLVAVAFTLITAATLFQQAQLTSFLRPADQRNPYAYVHSTPDVLKYRARAEAALARAPNLPIRVISEEYWPLPWYLRGLPNVGYYTTSPENSDGVLVIASASQAEAVRANLRGTYHQSFLGLRPGFVCVLFTLEP